MINVRFVEGSFTNYDVIFDCHWPTAPRTGELITYTKDLGDEQTWTVKHISHVMGTDETHVGMLAWIQKVTPGSGYDLDAW